MPEIGDKAPEFSSKTDGGGEISLSDFGGNRLSCTSTRRTARRAAPRKLAISAIRCPPLPRKRGRHRHFEGQHSPHDNFKAKYDLNFPLVSDESGEICEAFGVWVEKKNYGRTYMGIERTTFLIDGAGGDPGHLAQSAREGACRQGRGSDRHAVTAPRLYFWVPQGARLA